MKWVERLLECTIYTENTGKELESQVQIHRIILHVHKIISFRIMGKITVKHKDSGLTLPHTFLLKISKILKTYSGWWLPKISQ